MNSLNLIFPIQAYISREVTSSTLVLRQKNKCAVKDIKNSCTEVAGDSLHLVLFICLFGWLAWFVFFC